MGFMDKAKQMADQAQAKIEDAQKQFNDSQSQKSAGQAGPGVRYDANGRPIADDAGTPAAPPAAQTPAAPVVVGDTANAADETPAGEQPPVTSEPAPTPTAEGVNAAPDPFKPIE